MRYILGIDIGTSALKAALCTEDGRIIAKAAEGYPVFYPHEGWAEQDPNDWWDACVKAVKKVIEGIDPTGISGIGIDGQSWSAVAVSKDGKVLTNTPIWMDTRADDICEKWKKEIGEEKIFALCGNPVKPSYTTPKVAWYRENLPEVYKDAEKILTSNGFIVYRLTGLFSIDMSQGYGWHCFDMTNRVWDYDMCARLGIDKKLLPDIYACHAIVGGVNENAARLTGLKIGTPVVAGGLDAACGTLGVGVLEKGETQEQGGQAGGMSICCESAEMEKSLILSCHVVPGRWLLQGGTVGGSGVMRWLEKEFGASERAEAEKTGESVYQIMNEEAEKIAAGSDGLIFLPYMAGERSPIWDSKAKGVFYGLDFTKTRAHMIRAGMEGVAYSLKHNLDIAEKAGAKVETMRAMGGAANSVLWTQIKCDITGKKITVPSSDEATTMGAMMLAGVGTGVWKDFNEAVDMTVTVTREHEPDMSKHEAYEKGYRKYLKLYPALKEINREE